MNNKFPKFIFNDLKYYVYLYSHPITNEVFYVGKGKGNRAFSHLDEIKDSEKVKYISYLRQSGLEPNIEILIHGLESEEMALRVESSIIDLLNINNLKNINKGYQSASFGRMSINQIKSLYERKQIDVNEPSLLIRISKAFRYSMSERELYDFTRGFWKVSLTRAEKAKYAFAVYQGIIQEVYKIDKWYQAETTENVRNPEEEILLKTKGRFEFTGEIAPREITDKYKYKSVEHYFKKGNSNPIMYVNI